MTRWQGERFKELFRCGLGYAAQWMDGLCALIEKHTESILEQANTFLQAQNSPPAARPTLSFNPDVSRIPYQLPPYRSPHPPSPELPSPPSSPPSGVPKQPPCPLSPSEESLQQSKAPLMRSECARRLRQLCPACFGGGKHGRSLEEYVRLPI